MRRRLFHAGNDSSYKSLNKFISNSSALKNKERITTSSRKGNWVPKVVCTIFWSLPGIKLFSNNWERRYLAGCWEGPLSFISNSSALEIKRESRLVPGKETGFQKSCVQYSGVYQESNTFDNWERHYLAGCWEGQSSFISNSSALKIKKESSLVPGKETGFQKSCVQLFWSLPGIKRFLTIGKNITWRLLGRSIVHPSESYSLQGMY